MPKNKLKVLMASAEITPFAKVGGLADVVGSLPPALKKLGCDVRLIMPLYGSIDRKKYRLKKILTDQKIFSAGKITIINLWQSYLPNTKVPIYFIDAPEFFQAKAVYLDKNNAERFLFFSLASLRVLPLIKFLPDIVHCHDFHTGLIPDLLKTTEFTFFKDIKTLFTIHNLNYQGKSEIEVLKTGNLTPHSLACLSQDAQDGDINFIVQGILNADIINTVSKTYTKEIATSQYGAGLDKIVRSRKKDLYGIVNGIDTNFFNPAKDKLIKQKYSTKSLNKKIFNKLALQKKVGLPQNKNIALAGLISRFVWQKGLDLFTEELPKLDCQFVVLGTGQKHYEQNLKKLAKKFPYKFSAQIKFDEKLAHLIYAGADIFLMPSRFEPCGLGQLISMRYGTVPIVRRTGGLADTVTIKQGFSFKEFSTTAFRRTIKKALNMYYKESYKWKQLQINGMNKDFSWHKSAQEYIKLYRKVLVKKY